jgi:hypothetical protein
MTPVGNPTAKEVAERLRCSLRQVFYLLKRGVLQAAPRAGRARTVLLTSVEAFETQGMPEATPRCPRRPTARFSASDEVAAFKALRQKCRNFAGDVCAPVRVSARFTARILEGNSPDSSESGT